MIPRETAHERNAWIAKFEAFMGGNGRSGIFTLREKNSRKVRTIIVLVLAKSSHRRSMHVSAGVLSVCTVTYDLRFRVPVAD